MKVLFAHNGSTKRYNNKIYDRTFTNKMVNRYLHLGDSVTKITRIEDISKHEAERYPEVDHKNFRVIPLPNFTSFKTLKNRWIVKRIVKKAVKEHDVVLAKFPSFVASIAYKEAKRLNKPVLIEMGGCPFDALWNYDIRGKLLALPTYFYYKKLLRNASHIIYVTNQFLQNRYPTNGKSINCSNVELKEIDEKDLKSRLEKISHCKGRPLTLITLAAIDVPYKGQADVIQAIASLKSNGKIFKYKIIGNGNPERLQQTIDNFNLEDEVEIVGGLPHEKVFNELKNSDIYIQPSKQEGLPRSVVEAMSMACPVIGTNVAAIPELIDKECVYQKGNISDLIRILSKIDKGFMIRHAKLNFDESKKYKKNVLRRRRFSFYETFKNDFDINK